MSKKKKFCFCHDENKVGAVGVTEDSGKGEGGEGGEE